MRKVSSATVAVILGVALYFALFWGFDAVRMLTSPTCGLVWRSQFVFGTGRVFGLGPMGLIQLAAFFGTLKLAVAGICAVHIVDRFRCLAGGKAASEILEGGLILVVLVTIASVGPAVWAHNSDLVREQAIQLLLAGIATALCVVERSYGRPATADEPDAATATATAPPGAAWFSPWRLGCAGFKRIRF